MSMCTEEPSIE